MKFFRRGRHRRESRSNSASSYMMDDEDDVSSVPSRNTERSTVASRQAGSSRVVGSGRRSKRRSLFKQRRKETQDILAEPNQFLEKLLENGLFGPETPLYLDDSRKPGTIYKEGRLEKQGNFFKTWHRRYFVLSSRGLSYYESKKKYRNGYLPFGVIPFKDIVTEGGQVVHDVPDHLVTVLQLAGRRNLFCIHIDNRTYVMSSQTKEDKHDWAKAITKAYHKAMDKTLQAVKHVKKTGKRPSYFEDINSRMDLDTHFELGLTKLRNTYDLQRTLTAWKVYTSYNKKRRAKLERGSVVVM